MNRSCCVKKVFLVTCLVSGPIDGLAKTWKHFDQVNNRTGQKVYRAVSDTRNYKAALGCKYNGGIVLAFLFPKTHSNGYGLVNYQIDENNSGQVHVEIKDTVAYVMYPPNKLIEQMKVGSVMRVISPKTKKGHNLVSFKLSGFSDSWIWMTKKCIL
ncbi:hypothetical protein OPW39_15535 [Vibrio europaeus]|uniref:hypothetical protein n=1 Tax=Vibrio europaeus TaxID=300876 RepID=UPI00233F5329|nr:hypothetical protein [Vibrio europaeus]MDC5870219.1 hypothetical protein [Vibrio europaeus]